MNAAKFGVGIERIKSSFNTQELFTPETSGNVVSLTSRHLLGKFYQSRFLQAPSFGKKAIRRFWRSSPTKETFTTEINHPPF
jgi:hypothetical protein